MPADITDLIASIDGLHQKQEADRLDRSISSIAWAANDTALQSEMYRAWPAIRDRLGELERKAKAFDAIASESVLVGRWSDHAMGPCWRVVTANGVVPDTFGHDLLTAVEAAIAAKETEQ